ncbi:MAG: hypothetical protein IKK33_13125 [Lachnospiraceae bacterium]|nr:hypothetical protein [Lachnospiraceae bacterium]
MGKGEVLKKQIQYYVYCIGSLFFLKFGKMIGNNGIVYLAIGIETMALLMVFIGDGISDVYSKMLRSRRKRGLYHDAIVVKSRLKTLQIVLSIFFIVLTLIFADTIGIKLFHVEKSALIIRLIAPVLLIRAINNLLGGYLQSLGKFLSLSVINVLRVILFGILGSALVNNRMAYGEKVAALLKNDDYIGLYGAMGLAITILITEIVILTVMCVLYFLNDYGYDKKKQDRNLHKTEGFKETISNYVYLNNKQFLFGFFKRLFILVPLIIILNDINNAGVLYGKFLPLCGIPVFLVCARYYLLYSRLVSIIRNKDGRMVREHIQTGIQYTWTISLLFSVLLAVLAPQITEAFFTKDIIMKELLQYGSVLILIITMLAYLFLVNMAHNRKLECYITMLITAIINCVLSNTLYDKLQKPNAILYAACISLTIGILMLGTVTIFLYGLRLEYIYVFMLPLICIGVSGVVVLLVGKYMTPHIGNTIACIIGTILGIVLYLAGLSLCRVFSEQEVERLYGPLGRKIFSFIFK